MKYPRAIAVDEHNNALVCCQTSNNIHVIKADGTKHKILISEPDGIKQPIGMCYRASDGVIVVGGYNMSNILVISLQ